MKPKFTLVVALFLALVAGVVAPVSASAHERHRVHVYFYYGSQPSYYYQPAPAYYYQPESTVHYYRAGPRYRHHRWEEREHWRRYHRWHRDWDRDGD